MTDPSDAALRAIAHPARRAMLRLVWEHRAASLGSWPCCRPGLSRPAVSQHLKQLREAGLVTVVRVDANRRLYRADLAQMARLASFLDAFWAAPLQRL